MQRSNSGSNPFLLDTSNYRCLECGTLFTNESSIESHIQKFHSANFGFSCPHCQRSYKDNWHLNRHIMSHGLTDGKDPKVLCTQCGKSFRDSWQLGRHQMGGRCREDIEEEPTPAEVAEAERVVYTEWTEEAEPPAPRRPFTPCSADIRINTAKLLYFCKICGDFITRIRFYPHVALHFNFVYQQRTDESPVHVTSSFLTQTDDDVESVDTPGKCRRCARNKPAIANIKENLKQLREVLPPPRISA